MNEKMNPSKRLKNWHKKYAQSLSLRRYASQLAVCVDPQISAVSLAARIWLNTKHGEL